MLTDRVKHHAPWSFSKFNSLEQCSLQYYRKHVQRATGTRASGQAKVGVAVHYVLEHSVRTPELIASPPPLESLMLRAADKHELTLDERDVMASDISQIETFITWFQKFWSKNGAGRPLVEWRLAIDANFKAVAYNDPTALMRGIIDLGVTTRNNDLVVWDHKSGKHKDISEHAPQLNVYRLLGVTNFDVRAVQCAIHYVETARIDWTPPMSADVVKKTLPDWLSHTLNKCDEKLRRVDALEPLPEPGWACKYCEYRLGCPEGLEETARRDEARAAKQRQRRAESGNL